jgi:hypothetical protein
MFTRPYMDQMQNDGLGSGNFAANINWGDLAASATGFHTANDPGYKWGYPPSDPTSAQTGYHQFPCSKCHTPHATLLPRLMATNCLDIGNSGQYLTNSGTGYQWPQYLPLKKGASQWDPDTVAVMNLAPSLSSDVDAWKFSVTCHADRDGPGNNTPIEGGVTLGDGITTDGAAGWNRVTPW